MKLLSFKRLLSKTFCYSAAMLAGLFLYGSMTQSARAASVDYAVSLSFGGVTDNLLGTSAEPVIGIGDGYSGSLNFVVNQLNEVSNISGSLTANGYATMFTGYDGPAYIGSTASSFGFSVNPVGAGDWTIEKIEFELSAPGLSAGQLYDFAGRGGVVLGDINIIALKFGSIFSNNLDRQPMGSFSAREIDPMISAVPLPAGLPLYAAGLAVLGFVGWRKKQKIT